MRILVACVLPLLFSTASSAAALQVVYLPPAGGASGDATVKRQNRNRAPMPAPAPTDHYAAPASKTWTLA